MTRNARQEPEPAVPRRRSGQLEGQVITVLVEAGQPLTPGEVLEKLGASSGLSYSTVVTILTRLHTKGAVTRRRDGRPYRYGAVSDAATLSASRMSRLLAEEPDRASVLRRFVNALDPEDERTLRALLRETDA
ncbi:BlaI/MecI/CopY family transcriptional regulator [Yinghuangia sp. ASG 101]|uniref:BlaI/MecI/CopY family transcriptional regulator n=1 Tax=Yinghuangia sp. ASG 101 TaxID=2896848 RepID=UPI001E4F91BA|nr:BlaI/MecI/CopY family transcriptional regulator [Yinghuangia sp. ASG 101]UGQ13462.1 BlaI/MecI/CopY family transcriptional regulator [Yinghuangia sp. ASG 101]